MKMAVLMLILVNVVTKLKSTLIQRRKNENKKIREPHYD